MFILKRSRLLPRFMLNHQIQLSVAPSNLLYFYFSEPNFSPYMIICRSAFIHIRQHLTLIILHQFANGSKKCRAKSRLQQTDQTNIPVTLLLNTFPWSWWKKVVTSRKGEKDNSWGLEETNNKKRIYLRLHVAEEVSDVKLKIQEVDLRYFTHWVFTGFPEPLVKNTTSLPEL